MSSEVDAAIPSDPTTTKKKAAEIVTAPLISPLRPTIITSKQYAHIKNVRLYNGIPFVLTHIGNRMNLLPIVNDHDIMFMHAKSHEILQLLISFRAFPWAPRPCSCPHQSVPTLQLVPHHLHRKIIRTQVIAWLKIKNPI